MPLEHERSDGLGVDALVTVCSWKTDATMVWVWMRWQPCALGTRTLFWFCHGCTGHCMLLEHEHYSGLGMDDREYGMVMVAVLARVSGEGDKP